MYGEEKIRGPAKLFVFEGPDGVGKTEIARRVVERLKDQRDTEFIPFPGREAGSLGQLVYRLYHSPGCYGVTDVVPAAMQTLFVASHIDGLSRRIRPALRRQEVVVLDRFWWSVVAYCAGEKVASQLSDALRKLEQEVWQGINPSAAFLVFREEPFRRELSREAWRRCVSAYQEIAREEGDKYPVFEVRNTGTVEEACEKVWKEIHSLL